MRYIDEAYAAILYGILLCDDRTLVDRTIVDENDFQVWIGLHQDAIEAPIERRGSIVIRNDDGDGGLGRL